MGQRGSRYARTGVLDDQLHPIVGRAAGRDRDAAARRVSGRILEQIGEDLVHEQRVHAHRRQVFRHRDLDRRRSQQRRQALDHRIDQVGQVVQLERRMQRAAFDPAQVEHVAHQPAQALRLRVDRAGGGPLFVARPIHVGVHQVPGGSPDRGQRRAQVVRNRIEKGGFQGIALAGHFRGRRLGGEAVADDRLAELVGCGGEKAGVRSAREGVAVDARGPDRADGLAAGLDRHAEDGHGFVWHAPGQVRRLVRKFLLVSANERRLVDPLPLVVVEPTGGGIADSGPRRLRFRRTRMEHPARCERRSRLLVPAVGDDALLARRRSQPDPDAIHLRLAHEASREQRRGLQGRGRIGGVPAHGEHRPRLRCP